AKRDVYALERQLRSVVHDHYRRGAADTGCVKRPIAGGWHDHGGGRSAKQQKNYCVPSPLAAPKTTGALAFFGWLGAVSANRGVLRGQKVVALFYGDFVYCLVGFFVVKRGRIVLVIWVVGGLFFGLGGVRLFVLLVVFGWHQVR